MIWTKLELVAIFSTLCIVSCVSAGATLGHGDACVAGASVLSKVSDDVGVCADPFYCAGTTCSCKPGFVYEKGLLGWQLLGGGCKLAAAAPCTDSSTSCGSNSHCSTVCVCNEGYNGLPGMACNGAVKLGMTPMYFLGLMLSYLFFNN